jgi:hypothetical protein
VCLGYLGPSLNHPIPDLGFLWQFCLTLDGLKRTVLILLANLTNIETETYKVVSEDSLDDATSYNECVWNVIKICSIANTCVVIP